jgi:(2Fe-2S) ferredoxin
LGKSSEELQEARERAAKMALGNSVLTIAMCGDEKTAKCASACEMRESWKHLRRIAKSRRKEDKPRIVALKLECPGICRSGPIAAVFPSGTWYGGCDAATIDEIIAHHEAGKPSDSLAKKQIS